MNGAVTLLGGMLVSGYLVIGLYFVKLWREDRDRLFGYFAAAFFLLAIQRALLAMIGGFESVSIYLYGTRAVAFLIILYAIIDKNRRPAVPRGTAADAP